MRAPVPAQIPTEEIDIRLSELAKRVDAQHAQVGVRSIAQFGGTASARNWTFANRSRRSHAARARSTREPAPRRLVRPPRRANASRSRALKPPRASGAVWGRRSPRDEFPVGSRAFPAFASARAPGPNGPGARNAARGNSFVERTTRPHAGRGARESNERRLTANDAEALRAELAAMTRSLADLAPRNGGVALEGAVGDLGQRLSAARQAGADEDILAPVEAKLREVVEALRKYDPQAAVGALERDAFARPQGGCLSSAVVKPQALNEILRQTEDIRNLLAAAASQSVPVERLEKQIGQLADSVERLADSPSPRVETERVLDMLADTRARIERAIRRRC